MGMMLGMRPWFLQEHLLPLYRNIKAKSAGGPLAVDATPLHGLEQSIPLVAALEQLRIMQLQAPQGIRHKLTPERLAA